jgi:acid phosphatase
MNRYASPSIATLAATALMLYGCQSPPRFPSSPGVTGGVVIGSYFRNAKVCLDNNDNALCDPGESSTLTDANGKFVLNGASVPVVAEIAADAIRFDANSGMAAAVGRKIVLRAPADAAAVISAHSTAVMAEIEIHKLSFAQARAKIASALGISPDKLLQDFNQEADAAVRATLKTESDAAIVRIQNALAAFKPGDRLKTVLAGATGLLDQISNVVVIYGENRSFDNLYGLYPGANGVAQASAAVATQTDRDGTPLAALPPVWKEGNTPDSAFPAKLANKPFRIDAPPINLPLSTPTRDLVHRFYQNQEQINGGKLDQYAALSDAGGLVMGYYDGSTLPLWKLAQQYTLSDNFFMGAFGGSFFNHIWLICACTPRFPDAPSSMRAQLDNNGKLVRKPGSPASALTGPPQFLDGSVTADGYGVNTLQPSYQPSGAPPAGGGDPQFADPAKQPLPPQTAKTIGDTLSAAGISWAWYAGAFNAALADGTQDPSKRRAVIYNPASGSANFQPHHQPFNYFARFAPGSADRSAHLKDGSDFIKAIESGTLPQVAFYKPQGNLNEHPGYTDVLSGDVHIADMVAKIQAGPQWRHTVIIITYDENGGFWDHVPPPKGDRWGPGTRIPTIVISPYAKKNYVDSAQYDTTSIIKLLTRRFHLQPLPGARENMGDLSNAFDFGRD